MMFVPSLYICNKKLFLKKNYVVHCNLEKKKNKINERCIHKGLGSRKEIQ